jgi:hypothetical protein
MNVEVLPSCTPRIFSPLIGCPLPAHPRDEPHGPHGARKTLEAFFSTLRDTDLDALSDALVGVVRETMQPAHVSYGCAPIQFRRGSIHTSCRRSNYYTYLLLGCGSKTPLMSVSLYLKGPQVFPS